MKGYLLIAKIMDERIAKLKKRVKIRLASPASLFVKYTDSRRLTDRLNFLSPSGIGKLPLMIYGGCVMDMGIGIATISSDNIAAYLAIKLHAKRLIIVTDTDGMLNEKGETTPSLLASDYGKYIFIKGGMKDTVNLQKTSIKEGQRVLLVDYIVATGETMRTMSNMIEHLGGTVAAIFSLIELRNLNPRRGLEKYRFDTIVKY